MKPNESQKPQEERQLQETEFKLLEFSKKITYYDIIIYFILMAVIIVVMVLKSSLATYCVNIITAVSTTYVTLRLGYSAKACFENVNKIKGAYAKAAECHKEESFNDNSLG